MPFIISPAKKAQWKPTRLTSTIQLARPALAILDCFSIGNVPEKRVVCRPVGLKGILTMG